MKKRSKTFYRYVLSYALVLILPVALLFGMSYSYLIDRFSQEISDSNTRLFKWIFTISNFIDLILIKSIIFFTKNINS